MIDASIKSLMPPSNSGGPGSVTVDAPDATKITDLEAKVQRLEGRVRDLLSSSDMGSGSNSIQCSIHRQKKYC